MVDKNMFLPDFDISMKFSKQYRNRVDLNHWNILALQYNDFRTCINKNYNKQKIPKTLHQVWVGRKIPEREMQYVQQVRDSLPPDWVHILWGNEDINKLKYLNKELFISLGNTKNGIAKQADLIRYAVLYEFGGVYMDTDFVLHKDFNMFLHLDAFMGIAFDKEPNVFNGLIGSIKCSNFIKSLMQLDKPIHGDVLDVTGPWFITRKLFENLETGKENIVAFPCSFFYPYPNFNELKTLGADYTKYIQPESICTHLWSSSWM